MMSGPGALHLLRNLPNLVSVGRHRLPQAHAHCLRQIRSHLGPQDVKNTNDYPR